MKDKIVIKAFPESFSISNEIKPDQIAVDLSSEKPKSMSYDKEIDELAVELSNKIYIIQNVMIARTHEELKEVISRVDQINEEEIVTRQRDKLRSRRIQRATRVTLFAIALSLMPFDLSASTSIKANESAVYALMNAEKKSFSMIDDQSMVIQGICSVGRYNFITAYSSKGDNSKVYVIDEDQNIIKETKLYNNSHVGGIAYDEEHNLFWITDKHGTISGYSYESIIGSKKEVEPIYKKVDVGSTDLITENETSSVAYVAIHDGRIYVGNYSTSNRALLKSFEINPGGQIDLSSERKMHFINNAQGIAFYEKNNSTYMFVSTSSGRLFNSIIKVYKYDSSITDYRLEHNIDCIMPPMAEQLAFNEKGEMITVYESNASIYKTLLNIRSKSDIIITNIADSELVKKM